MKQKPYIIVKATNNDKDDSIMITMNLLISGIDYFDIVYLTKSNGVEKQKCFIISDNDSSLLHSMGKIFLKDYGQESYLYVDGHSNGFLYSKNNEIIQVIGDKVNLSQPFVVKIGGKNE